MFDVMVQNPIIKIHSTCRSCHHDYPVLIERHDDALDCLAMLQTKCDETKQEEETAPACPCFDATDMEGIDAADEVTCDRNVEEDEYPKQVKLMDANTTVMFDVMVQNPIIKIHSTCRSCHHDYPVLIERQDDALDCLAMLQTKCDEIRQEE